MIRFIRLVGLWFLCSQVIFVSVAGAGVAAHDDLHVATAHQLALDHHHHDDFSSHFDHDDGAGAHVHAVDSFQSFGLVQENTSGLQPFGGQKQLALLSARPSDIFLEGLLRPPQLLL
ncbi:MAG: hypothetical protein RJA17_968 [Pseudomonadota bacterium]|jgi:hypothetical protein